MWLHAQYWIGQSLLTVPTLYISLHRALEGAPISVKRIERFALARVRKYWRLLNIKQLTGSVSQWCWEIACAQSSWYCCLCYKVRLASMRKRVCTYKINLRSGSGRAKGGKGETKNRAWYNSSKERIPPTFLIDWHSTKQPIKISSACTILGMQISHNGNSQKVPLISARIAKSQATINLVGISAQIYTISNLKVLVPVLYMVALSEPKLNENSENDEVVMYENMLHAYKSFLISGGVRKYSLRICHWFSA